MVGCCHRDPWEVALQMIEPYRTVPAEEIDGVADLCSNPTHLVTVSQNTNIEARHAQMGAEPEQKTMPAVEGV